MDLLSYQVVKVEFGPFNIFSWLADMMLTFSGKAGQRDIVGRKGSASRPGSQDQQLLPHSCSVPLQGWQSAAARSQHTLRAPTSGVS